MGVEQVIDLAGVLVGRALHYIVIMAVHGNHGAAALEVDAGGLTRVHEVEAVARRHRDFLGLLRDGGGGQGRLIEPTIIDLIVGVSIAVAQLLEDALAHHGIARADGIVKAGTRRYRREGVIEGKVEVEFGPKLIVGEGGCIPLAHVVDIQKTFGDGFVRFQARHRFGEGDFPRYIHEVSLAEDTGLGEFVGRVVGRYMMTVIAVCGDVVRGQLKVLQITALPRYLVEEFIRRIRKHLDRRVLVIGEVAHDEVAGLGVVVRGVVHRQLALDAGDLECGIRLVLNGLREAVHEGVGVPAIPFLIAAHLLAFVDETLVLALPLTALSLATEHIADTGCEDSDVIEKIVDAMVLRHSALDHIEALD